MRRNPILYLAVFNAAVLLRLAPKAGANEDSTVSYCIFAAVSVIVFILLYRSWKKSRQTDTKIETTGDIVWKKLKRSRLAIAGIVILLIIIYLAILAPFVVPMDPLEMDWAAIAQPPSLAHWLGTDDTGRDMLSRTIYGSRVALGIGFTAVVLNTLLGTSLGLLAGYFGGKTDFIIMRALEFWSSLPFILFAIALMAALGTGILNLIIVVSLTGIMEFARIIRSEAMQIRKTDYVNAGLVLGLPHPVIIMRHILPNCLAPITVMATLRVGDTILTIAGLSFLGLGINPPTPSLGSMLASGQQFLYENPAMSLVPGTTILLIVLAANLFGDGLRDAFDSKLNE